MTDLTGQFLGKYKVVARLDKGAMGEVYQGYHTSLNRNVAIKVLHPHLATAPDFVERFEREASIVARLRHTNIVQVYDFDVLNGLYYMVMEFVDGPNLSAEIKQRQSKSRPLTLLEIGYITHALAAALDYAHVRGVIHRDIKPANIMFNAEGQIVLTDFGIVHIMGDTVVQPTGTVLGTPAYMAPEQALGESVGHASDIYALGVVLFELVTGQLPFKGNNALEVIQHHLNTPAPPPRQYRKDIPIELEQAILKALHKDPLHRQQKAGQLARDIRQAVGMSAEQALAYVNITAVPTPTPNALVNEATLLEADANVTMIASSVTGHTEAIYGAGPYRGLFAFREEDAKFFFGREEFTEQLLELVKVQPLVAVVGSSGSGKSSVVFAGLVATLRQEGNWIIEDFRPGQDPFQTIAGALVPLLYANLTAQQKPQAVKQLSQAMKNGERRLHEIVEQIVNAQPAGTRLLLVADQFEEMFTLCDDVALRHRFMDQLVEAVDIQKFRDEQRFFSGAHIAGRFFGAGVGLSAFCHRFAGCRC
ncbi:MAG: serine/threonine protein kinase [Chloroflexi bacterium]|nr:serine/threonine protein kinase [Chloroflexota bacterium]